MLEAYTALGALATATKKVMLGALVTGNTYRNPTLLAKAITTLDVVSGGRAVLGMGTGWFELEHTQLGFEFGTFTDRFAKLDEALQILTPMIAGERVTFAGRYYAPRRPSPFQRFRDRIPMLIGGSGEKKTFGLAARYFDHLNVIAPFGDLPGKVAALRRRVPRSSAIPRRWKPACCSPWCPIPRSPMTWFRPRCAGGWPWAVRSGSPKLSGPMWSMPVSTG